jgi:hypothetical protein
MEMSHRHAGSSGVPIYPFDSVRNEPSYNYLPSHSHLSHSHHPSNGAHHILLFDPDHPQRPHPTLMPHFIQLFFEQLGTEFPFISYEDTLRQFCEQSLAPLISNCIASLAVRFSSLPELALRGLHTVADTYGDNAKTILSSVSHLPAFETLHGLMLLSWSEYKNNRISSFRMYCQMAMRLAIELGLSEQNDMQNSRNDRERNRRRTTWSSIVQLHLTASSCKTCPLSPMLRVQQ